MSETAPIVRIVPSTHVTPSTPPAPTFFTIPIDEAVYDKTDEFSFVLKPSPSGGIGVFTTHGIVKGTYLEMFPSPGLRKFTHAQLAASPRLKAFCKVYGVDTQEGSNVSQNFGCMSVGWYLNHSDTPNAHHEKEWVASRTIAANEEITIDYREVDDP